MTDLPPLPGHAATTALGRVYTADQMRAYAARAVATAAQDVAVLSAEVERLEAALRAAWEQAEPRQPLGDDALLALWKTACDDSRPLTTRELVTAYGRAVEAAHGIGVKHE